MSRASTFTFVVFATAAHAAPMDVDTDLLEFLGEWATDDGGWIDPVSLGEQSGDEPESDEMTIEVRGDVDDE